MFSRAGSLTLIIIYSVSYFTFAAPVFLSESSIALLPCNSQISNLPFQHVLKSDDKPEASQLFRRAIRVNPKVKEAFRKAGKAIKNFGGKIAKVGFQVMATVQSVAAKAANFIPGIGRGVSAVLKAESKALSTASNAIHVPGKGLENFMKVTEKVRNPVGGAIGGGAAAEILSPI